MEHVVRGFECQQCHQFFITSELARTEVAADRVCPHDGGSLVPAVFCEKTAYQCAKCKLTSRKADKCKKCGENLDKVTDRARVVQRCTKCKTNFDEAQPGNKCPTCGKALKAWCSKSGTFPHGTDPTNNASSCGGK